MEFTRDDFMDFFRDDEKLNTLSVDDRIEVFSTILLGNSDFKKPLLDQIFSDYQVAHLDVVEVGEENFKYAPNAKIYKSDVFSISLKRYIV